MRGTSKIGKALVMAAILLNSPASWLVIPGLAEAEPPRVFEKAGERTADLQSRLNETYGKLPLSFEANQGQFDSHVKFASRTQGQTIYLTSTEAVLCLYTPPRWKETDLSPSDRSSRVNKHLRDEAHRRCFA